MERPSRTTDNESFEASLTGELKTLYDAATAEFGQDAQFTYQNSTGQMFTLGFDEAIRICGSHIEKESVDSLLEKLTELRQNFLMIENSPHREFLMQRSRNNGQQKLAERALKAE